MQVSNGLTDVSEILLDLGLSQRTGFNFLKQGAIIGVLQDHVRNFALLINLVIEKLNDFGM
jgi:hypothetical protein